MTYSSFQGDLASTFLEGLEPIPNIFTTSELQDFREWCTNSGILPEGPGGSPFSLTTRKYLEDIYNQTREAPPRRMVKRKAAQLGLTVQMLYRAAWFCADPHQRLNVGLYFPSDTEVLDLHSTRFRPMMRSSGRMMRLVGAGGTDNVRVVRLGTSNMRFRGMRSITGTDSVPLDVVLFDEVRLMSTALIERAFLRISASTAWPGNPPGIIDLQSTAGFPGADIDAYFQQSTKHTWHVSCPNTRCKNHTGFIMEHAWPDCVDFTQQHYICPKCGTRIPDPQAAGRYERLGPADAYWDGYTFSKILLGEPYLPEMIRAYESMVIAGQNPSEFYNSFLGLPHRDPNAVIITEPIFDASMQLEPTYVWPTPDTPAPTGEWFTGMGVDQRLEEKHIIILRRAPTGKIYLAHAEVILAQEGISEETVRERVAAIAQTWRVNVGVVDRMPDYSFSSGLARMFAGGMWHLAEYKDQQDEPLRWADLDDIEQFERTQAEGRYPYLVKIHRYAHLLQAFNLYRQHRLITPVDALTAKQQEVIKKGRRIITPIGALLKEHLANIAKVSIPIIRRHPTTGEEIRTGKYQYVFRHLALEPHFAHAFAYAVAAVYRRTAITTITGGTTPNKPPPPTPTEKIAQLPPHLQPRTQGLHQKNACITCRFFTPNTRNPTSLGECSNERIALELRATPPVKTRPTNINCRHYRKKEA